MCKYCEEGYELGFGRYERHTIKSNKVYIRPIEEGCIAVLKINYCPMCGKKLKEGENK